MNMNQVAIAYTTDGQRDAIKAMLGLTDAPWVKDIVYADVTVMDRNGGYSQGQNVAELEFCMAMGGQQFELIRYLEGPNWLATAMRMGAATPFIAHIGFHLDEGEEFPPMDHSAVLVQEARTTEHSNAEVNAAERRYHYRIFRVGQCYLKFIKRLTVGQAVLEEASGIVKQTSE